MTDTKAKVVAYDLHPHPNADLLAIAVIRGTGWQCVVSKNTDPNGLGVYIPIDGEVPVDKSEFAFLAAKAKDGKFRIKTLRLRGSLSQGLLIPAPPGAQLGDDLTEVLGVTRWEPPIPPALAGDMDREPGSFQKYTSIENAKNFPNVFTPGEMVRVTEKLHGTNCRFGYVNDGSLDLRYCVGTHRTARKLDGNNLYSRVSRELEIQKKLKPFVDEFGSKTQFIIFGEIYGFGVQDLHYGCAKNKQELRLFDVLVDFVYQPWEVTCRVADALGIEAVPLLYRGPYDHEKIVSLRDGKTTLGGQHVREGVVVTAEPEQTVADVGRKILKFISDDYLLRANATDGH